MDMTDQLGLCWCVVLLASVHAIQLELLVTHGCLINILSCTHLLLNFKVNRVSDVLVPKLRSIEKSLGCVVYFKM